MHPQHHPGQHPGQHPQHHPGQYSHQPHHQPGHQPNHRQPAHTLVYSPQCPNCMRFLDALGRTPIAADVAVVDVHSVPPERAAHLAAVPALVTGDGSGTLYGTKAFEWLKQFEADVELDGFVGGNGSLGFSDVNNARGYVTYAQRYSAFTPMPDE